MANVLVQESSLENIADSIRGKNGTANTYTPAQMSPAIDALTVLQHDSGGYFVTEE